MPEKFKNMDELINYLAELETRVQILEERQEYTGRKLAKNTLPNSGIINQNFFKRAFTVWGHFITANLIIGIIIGCAMLIINMTLITATLQKLQP